MRIKLTNLKKIIKESIINALNESENSNNILNKTFVTYGLGNDYDANKFRDASFDGLWGNDVNKPDGGLWACPIDTKIPWYEYLKNSMEERLYDLNSHFLFKLKPTARIFVIDNGIDLIKYRNKVTHKINYQKMSDDGYDGVFVTEKALYDFGFYDDRDYDTGYMKLGAYDVESICVWNKDVIVPIHENLFDKLKNVPFHGDGEAHSYDFDNDWDDVPESRMRMQMGRDFDLYGNHNVDSDMGKSIRDIHPAILAQGDENKPSTKMARKFNGTGKSGL